MTFAFPLPSNCTNLEIFDNLAEPTWRQQRVIKRVLKMTTNKTELVDFSLKTLVRLKAHAFYKENNASE